MHSHSHGAGIRLSDTQMRILSQGFDGLRGLCDGIEQAAPMPSERYPTPVATAVCGSATSVAGILAALEERIDDPVSVLELGLALVEAYETHQGDSAGFFPEDMPFVGQVFSSKRCNGWCHVLGGTQEARDRVVDAIRARWAFAFFDGPSPYRATGVYVLLERLVRYAFVYGRCTPGDPHEMSHFIEDHTPGVLVCLPGMDSVELTLSLAMMKMGVPAVVPEDYPFSLGRSLRVSDDDEIAEAVVGFANIRRLLDHPDVPGYPSYCLEHRPDEAVSPVHTLGDTPESFYLLRKAEEDRNGVVVTGELPHGGPTGLGVLVEIPAEPMDAFDCDYIERSIVRELWRLPGHKTEYRDGKLVVGLGAGVRFEPERLGAVICAAVKSGYPRVSSVHVTVCVGDAVSASVWATRAVEDRAARLENMRATTEESMPCFYGCVGCSPFAPDHVCVLTVDRSPQCGRPYGMIKTGAHYGYDDMSFIHHSRLHRDINSFFTVDKGDCLDPQTGEWRGVNEHAARMTEGRTTRIQLHSLKDAPTTGCGCFNYILFETDLPSPGIGIMHRNFGGAAPDGRRWSDLHYALAGKQSPGISGCAAGYFSSPRFLQADGGWARVVWVSDKVAALAKARLPHSAEIGTA